jgi:hypothetical protein
LTFGLRMAHVKSYVWPIGGAAASSSGGEGEGSEERTISARPSDTGSYSDGGDARVESSHSESFYFGPSTMIVSRIHGMINNGYFADGMGHEPGEETVPEPHADEAVLFEEFFCWLKDASAPCGCYHFAEISDTNSLAYAQRYGSIVKVYLGRYKLWWRSIR